MKIKFLISKFLSKLFNKNLNYINGPETLPPPLTAAEEEKLYIQDYFCGYQRVCWHEVCESLHGHRSSEHADQLCQSPLGSV